MDPYNQDDTAWIQTISGGKFHLLAPTPDEVELEDIVWSLSMQCRFVGHVASHYTVAEHSILVSYAVAPEHALHALLHDATEAYVGDLSRPLKQLLPQYKEIEDSIWEVIALKLGIPSAMPAEVKEADARILINERMALMPRTRYPWGVDHLEPLPGWIVPEGWSPDEARERFMDRYWELKMGPW